MNTTTSTASFKDIDQDVLFKKIVTWLPLRDKLTFYQGISSDYEVAEQRRRVLEDMHRFNLIYKKLMKYVNDDLPNESNFWPGSMVRHTYAIYEVYNNMEKSKNVNTSLLNDLKSVHARMKKELLHPIQDIMERIWANDTIVLKINPVYLEFNDDYKDYDRYDYESFYDDTLEYYVDQIKNLPFPEIKVLITLLNDFVREDEYDEYEWFYILFLQGNITIHRE